MKLIFHSKAGFRQPGQQAFTMVEVMVVMVIFIWLVLAITAVQIFAMRMNSVATAQISATTGGRQALNSLRDQIRSTRILYVGTYTNGGGFTMTPLGSFQQGNSLEIGFTNGSATPTTNFLIYYLDMSTPTNVLYSISNNDATTLAVQTRYVTNYNCFFAEDYRGQVLSNYVNNPVIHVVFQISQWQCLGGNALSARDFYSLSTRIERRANY
jgi:type II secretory pathway pseudopilin PulG